MTSHGSPPCAATPTPTFMDTPWAGPTHLFWKPSRPDSPLSPMIIHSTERWLVVLRHFLRTQRASSASLRRDAIYHHRSGTMSRPVGLDCAPNTRGRELRTGIGTSLEWSCPPRESPRGRGHGVNREPITVHRGAR